MAADIELGLAKLADADEIARMSRDLIEIGLGWRWTPARVAHQIRCPDTVVLAARHGNLLAGFAIMHFLAEDAHLMLLAVHPAYRRQGLGRRLLGWLEKSARVAGISTLHLEVRATNQTARAFYRSLGYQEVRFVPCYYSPLESAISLIRELRALQH